MSVQGHRTFTRPDIGKSQYPTPQRTHSEEPTIRSAQADREQRTAVSFRVRAVRLPRKPQNLLATSRMHPEKREVGEQANPDSRENKPATRRHPKGSVAAPSRRLEQVYMRPRLFTIYWGSSMAAALLLFALERWVRTGFVTNTTKGTAC
jgi:hypothetical protein